QSHPSTVVHPTKHASQPSIMAPINPSSRIPAPRGTPDSRTTVAAGGTPSTPRSTASTA
ncbi:unnamed protein product, partial [Closterium sp. Naga37s-1]